MVVAEVSVFDAQQRRSEFVGSGEDEDAAWVFDDFLDQLHLVDGLYPALHERGSLGVVSMCEE